jgi:ribosomal protein L24E
MIKWYDTIEAINKKEWDCNLNENYYYHTSTFLGLLEKSKINNCKLFYVAVYHNNELVASSVISLFTMNIDLFIGNNSFVRFCKKLSPNFFNIKLLFCGTPISAGQTNIWVQNDSAIMYETLLHAVNNKLQQLSKIHKVKFMCIKELDSYQLQIVKPIAEKLNFFQGYSLPTMDAPLSTNDTKKYLQSLNYSQRRHIQQSLKKIGMNFLTFQFNMPVNGVAICKRALNADDAPHFYEQYMQVMHRAKVKFETLNIAFFETYFQELKDSSFLITCEVNNVVFSSILIIEQPKSLTFLFTSKPEAKDMYDSYFNTISAMLHYAVTSGKEILYLGQTAYQTKKRIGGAPRDLYLFFKAQNKILNYFLRKASNIIFPKMIVK